MLNMLDSSSKTKLRLQWNYYKMNSLVFLYRYKGKEHNAFVHGENLETILKKEQHQLDQVQDHHQLSLPNKKQLFHHLLNLKNHHQNSLPYSR